MSEIDMESVHALRIARRQARAARKFGRTKEDRRNYRLELAYDGSGFIGWQQQPNGRTVEGALVEALRPLVPGIRGLMVGGRTDRGVHASGQVASFWTYQTLDALDIRDALNEAAPGEIYCASVRRVPRRFHARFSAKSRAYAYLHDDGGALDVDRLNRLLTPLVGLHDFFAFSRSTPVGASTIRRIYAASVRRVRLEEDRSGLAFIFSGNGFIRHQIRVMVATLLREATSNRSDGVMLELLLARERMETAEPASPGGLILTKIGYDAET